MYDRCCAIRIDHVIVGAERTNTASNTATTTTPPGGNDREFFNNVLVVVGMSRWKVRRSILLFPKGGTGGNTFRRSITTTATMKLTIATAKTRALRREG